MLEDLEGYLLVDECIQTMSLAQCSDSTKSWIILFGVMLASIAVLIIARFWAQIRTFQATAFAPTISRWLSHRVKPVNYEHEDFFKSDGAPEKWVEVRKNGLDRLANRLRDGYTKSIAWGGELKESFSDLRFADANRVPFPFAKYMREKFELCSVVTHSEGPYLYDLDGNKTLDISGSYGVNVAGYDRYKEWMSKGFEKVKDLGPVLGPLHPLVSENIDILKKISNKSGISFHMSGTEAVMAGVRLARFNTGRKLIVTFSGAYHGWWDGVQPGLGSERSIEDCIVLKDTDKRSLEVIRRKAHQIAGVLVNPIQSFHPNSPPPNDAVLLTSTVRKTQDPKVAYKAWLKELKEVCEESRVPLIFDEVYTGFRLAPGGAQEYFDVEADMTIYGKTVAGGMPIGVVCCSKKLMQRFDPNHPMRFAFVVGTFSGHPVVMGAMNEFLNWVTTERREKEYQKAEDLCGQWVKETNTQMIEKSLPVRLVNFGTVWTVLFKTPGRYNWLLQYYMRAEGINLSFVGTGRCLTSLDFKDADYKALGGMLTKAVEKMYSDGWWLTEKEVANRDKKMQMNLVKEVLGSLVQIKRPVLSFYKEVMRRKHDDHHASHSHPWNQFFHIVSSSVFLICYVLIFSKLTFAMGIGLAALLVRQAGHAIIEPPCHDKEELLLGLNTITKSFVVGGYLLIPFLNYWSMGSGSTNSFSAMFPMIAEQWFYYTLFVVLGHITRLVFKHGFRLSMVWFVKLITDPITDMQAYTPRYIRPIKALFVR